MANTLSITTLIRISQQTKETYCTVYSHGSHGKTKAETKNDDFLKAVDTALQARKIGTSYDPNTDPMLKTLIKQVMGERPYQGNHKVGSYRTILVKELAQALGLGDLKQDDLNKNPLWNNTCQAVKNALLEMAQTAIWINSFGLELSTFDDILSLNEMEDGYSGYTHRKYIIRPIKSALQLLKLGAHEHDSLVKNCQNVLQIPESDDDEIDQEPVDYNAQYEHIKASIIAHEEMDPMHNARMLATANVARDVLHAHYSDPTARMRETTYNPYLDRSKEKKSRLNNLRLHPFVPGTLEYWFDKIPMYNIGPINAEPVSSSCQP